MIHTELSHLHHQLEKQVQVRTGRRVRNLAIELHPERVVLRGQAASYYVKQLAQHGIRELLPHISLENTIAVDYSLGAFPAMSGN
ncbi:MAG: hypothetical protein JO112_18025 [Planctomycetes bacterium]|nr:hypothetical protein [Planctomycetota bacterium]